MLNLRGLTVVTSPSMTMSITHSSTLRLKLDHPLQAQALAAPAAAHLHQAQALAAPAAAHLHPAQALTVMLRLPRT